MSPGKKCHRGNRLPLVWLQGMSLRLDLRQKLSQSLPLFSPFLLLSWDMMNTAAWQACYCLERDISLEPYRHDCSTGVTQGEEDMNGKRRAPSSAAPGEGAIPSLQACFSLCPKSKGIRDASNSSLKSTFRYIYICRLSCSMSKTSISILKGYKHIYIYIIV